MTDLLTLPGIPSRHQQQDIDLEIACPDCYGRLSPIECECALDGYAGGCAIETAEMRGEDAPRPWCPYGDRCPSCGWIRLDRWDEHEAAL